MTYSLRYRPESFTVFTDEQRLWAFRLRPEAVQPLSMLARPETPLEEWTTLWNLACSEMEVDLSDEGWIAFARAGPNGDAESATVPLATARQWCATMVADLRDQ